MYEVEPFIKPTLVRARADRGFYTVYQSYARGDVVEEAGRFYLAKIEHFTAGDGGRTFAQEMALGYWELLPDDVDTFLELSDTPATYGTPGQLPRINATATGLDWYTPPTVDVATWLSLPDTPSAYTGNAFSIVHVNAAENSVEFRPRPVEPPTLPVTNGQYVLQTIDAGATHTWQFAPTGGGAVLTADSVTALHIAPDAVGASELAPNSVNTSHIVNGTVQTVDIADNAITAAKLADNSVNGSAILTAAVGSRAIADGTVNTAELANGAVTSAKVADASLLGADMVAGTVTSRELGADSVGASELANNAVASANIVDGSVTEADLSPAVAAKLNAADSFPEVVLGQNSIQIPTAGTWRVLAIASDTSGAQDGTPRINRSASSGFSFANIFTTSGLGTDVFAANEYANAELASGGHYGLIAVRTA